MVEFQILEVNNQMSRDRQLVVAADSKFLQDKVSLILKKAKNVVLHSRPSKIQPKRPPTTLCSLVVTTIKASAQGLKPLIKARSEVTQSTLKKANLEQAATDQTLTEDSSWAVITNLSDQA